MATQTVAKLPDGDAWLAVPEVGYEIFELRRSVETSA
jgi:hypothetical protein